MKTLAEVSILAVLFVAPSLVADDVVDYQSDIEPVFNKYCLACHTADEAQGGFIMESYSQLMLGGDSGPAITPGVASSSRLFLMASGQLDPVMPPDDADGPTPVELTLISRWIDAGAPPPDRSLAKTPRLRTPRIPTREGIHSPSTAIAISTDGQHFATGGYRQVRIESPDGGPAMTIGDPLDGKVNALCFSNDGSTLLVASGTTGLSGQVVLFDVRTGDMLQAWTGHADVIQSVIFSPDETQIATASYDRTIQLWDASTGQRVREFVGHNGAIHSIAFSSDGKVLISGSADETVKVWRVNTGERLDTMSQPTGEVFAVGVTKDGQFVYAGCGDNRLRVWRLRSRDVPKINPLIATRFIDESPLTHIAPKRDGSAILVASQAGNLKLISTSSWTTVATLDPTPDRVSDIVLSVDDSTAILTLLNGQTISRELPSMYDRQAKTNRVVGGRAPIYLDLASLTTIDKDKLPSDAASSSAKPLALPRGAEVTGTLSVPGQEDWFSFQANQDEVWIVETDTSGLGSPLDSVIEIRDPEGGTMTQARLQATRDSYFTFRGKDSTQTNDFRIFAWEEMKLDEYLYASGEVTRLWLAPRGADSGFDMYPGRGNRWTYFGTSPVTHALGEPAFIVRELAADEPSSANGLPVFEVPMINDDDPQQMRGKDSVLRFHAPLSGRFLVRLRDTRGEGGDAFRYRLRIRPANPTFAASVKPIRLPLRPGCGREVELIVDRLDGFEGDVWFDIDSLPNGLRSSFPVRVQAGQAFALATIWADESTSHESLPTPLQPGVTASANILGKRVERAAGDAGNLKIVGSANATLEIVAGEVASPSSDTIVVPIRRGETISLTVRANRADKFTNEIPLGKEDSGRNLPHGVFVDNIGLNGLLIRENESERQFFLTADEIAELGRRPFFVTGRIDGNVTSAPVVLDVVP